MSNPLARKSRKPRNMVEPPTNNGRDPDIERVRAAYVRNVKRYNSSVSGERSSYGDKPVAQMDGGTSRFGRKYKPVWDGVLAWIREQDCNNIEGFIAAQFKYLGFNSARQLIPTPNQLKSTNSIVNYKHYTNDAIQEFTSHLLSDSNLFETELIRIEMWYPDTQPPESWSMVLSDTGSPISPLFRYCVAESEGLSDEAQVLYSTALDQLLLDSINYRRYWDKLLPNIFKVSPHALLLMERECSETVGAAQ